ncbi:ABC transporter permease [Levilactobacillus bambusae]|uniref:Spermidine/putrescine ABC transporter permease n=1 Tax=Levilactobacillus bambusae TaxID=2024736 RepID=A0A2V1MYP1_9LACO|nr:ABC transporter permease [Levilactobacillus bambusae]PWG00089.1 spermidine/putrescine ABC transporter permease [Levilactobacillus bambusae]
MPHRHTNWLYGIPYWLWIGLFVIAPVALIIYQSFFNIDSHFTLNNYATYFHSGTYLQMTVNSVWYALLVTFFTLLISYPAAYIMSHLKHRDLWLLLIILPTWINILLKAYAFIGIFSQAGIANQFLTLIGIGPRQLLFTKSSFLFVATYIQIPFMILPIYNAILDLSPSYVNASRDLGATNWQTFWRVIWPLTLPGVKSGIQAVFIPSLSLFMLTRLIGGNKIITLGTAIEEHFLTTMNWGMGSTIGVVLIIAMVIIMIFTNSDKPTKGDRPS